MRSRAPLRHWATLGRADWQWTNATTFVDDMGETWDALVDPPVVIAAAMNRTTRRKRFVKVAAMHAGVLPSSPDVGAGCHGRDDIIVDFASTLAPIVNGKATKLAGAPEFERKHASALLSALAGVLSEAGK